MYSDFKKLCLRYSKPVFEYAARVWISILAKATRESTESLEEVKLCLMKQFSKLYQTFPINSSTTFTDTELEDSYCLIIAALSSGISISSEYFNEIMTLKAWTTTNQILHTYLVPIHIEHPAVGRILDISQLSDSEERLGRFLPYEKYADEAVKSLDPKFNTSDDASLVMERKLTRLVQAVTATGSHTLSRFAFDGFGLPSAAGKMTHSCIPNVLAEAHRAKSRIRYEAIALRDIEEDEPLTVSFIEGTDKFHTERDINLKELFGPGFQCGCVKCRFERFAGKFIFFETIVVPFEEIQSSGLGTCDLHRLCVSYMQDQQYMAVVNIGRILIQSQEADGDIYHLIGAALLSMNRWTEAQELWIKGLERFPAHVQLKNERLKQEVFSQINAEESLSKNGIYTIYETSDCGRIISSDLPIVDSAQCASIIAAAEEYAALGNGWTTSRHYAVPTTDIPVHLVPDVSAWLNRLMGNVIVPSVVQHFSDTDKCSVHIHDAFIVKYQVSEKLLSQRYLPLHSDESTHSFVLALNPTSEYEGGGTYFVDLGRSIRLGELHSVMMGIVSLAC